MRVLYLDLNADDLVEDYSLAPKAYGGGRVVAANLMPWMNSNGHHMEIWANPKCFTGVEEKFKPFCKGMSHAERLREACGIKGFDIVLHNFPSIKVICDGKDVVWLVGYGEHVHFLNTRIITYNDYQNPQICNPSANVYRARIGVPIPEFQEYEKEDYVFSCHRQVKEFGSELMMQMARTYKFRYITAGPISDDMRHILDYADNEYVIYLGIIDEETKSHYFKHAKCSTYLHSWSTPFNLSACTSAAYGTPCIATPSGFWPSFVRNGVNGYLVRGTEDFLTALSKCNVIDQRLCYESVKQFSAANMINDYMAAFTKILNESL